MAEIFTITAAAAPLKNPAWVDFGYLVAALCFIFGLKAMSAPRTARSGNLVGALGGVVAGAVLFISVDLNNLLWIIAALLFGSAIGILLSRRIEMTAMPQMVALLNGIGGLSAALIGFLELPKLDVGAELFAALFALIVGAVSFTGSLVTFLKLHELMTSRPVLLPAGRLLFGLGFVATLVVAGMTFYGSASEGRLIFLPAVLVGLALLLGALFVLPIGGADVPIAISLLNALTGLTTAASGFVLENSLLIIAGTLVGTAGTILTKLMAAAMGRPLTNILFGAFTQSPTKVGDDEEELPVRSVTPSDVAIQLGYARKVIVVPGYGLAVAQAQHTIRELTDSLMAQGIEVSYAMHPVAGRMPGHMNVLLAEAEVPYDQLRDMEEINGEFQSCDVALVVGANDVVNPAARTTPDAPIYGMPILNVSESGAVIFLKRSMRSGFAGVQNPLLYDTKTSMLFGDAKESLTKVLAELKALV